MRDADVKSLPGKVAEGMPAEPRLKARGEGGAGGREERRGGSTTEAPPMRSSEAVAALMWIDMGWLLASMRLAVFWVREQRAGFG